MSQDDFEGKPAGGLAHKETGYSLRSRGPDDSWMQYIHGSSEGMSERED